MNSFDLANIAREAFCVLDASRHRHCNRSQPGHARLLRVVASKSIAAAVTPLMVLVAWKRTRIVGLNTVVATRLLLLVPVSIATVLAVLAVVIAIVAIVVSTVVVVVSVGITVVVVVSVEQLIGILRRVALV